jgi:hypothetical protein
MSKVSEELFAFPLYLKAEREQRGWPCAHTILLWQTEDACAHKIGGPECTHAMTMGYLSLASPCASEKAITIEEQITREGISLLRILVSDKVKPEQAELRKPAFTLIGNHPSMQSYLSHPQRISVTRQVLHDTRARFSLTEPHTPSEHQPSQPEAHLTWLCSITAVTDKLPIERARQALYALPAFPPQPHRFADCSIARPDLLTAISLLQIKGMHRFLLHITIADDTGLLLEDSGCFDAAHTRLITDITACVKKQSTDYERQERETSTMLAVLEAAITMDRVNELACLACTIAQFLHARGLRALAEQHLQRAYEAARFTHNLTRYIYLLSALKQARRYRVHTTSVWKCSHSKTERRTCIPAGQPGEKFYERKMIAQRRNTYEPGQISTAATHALD